MRVRSALSKVFSTGREPTVKRAESAFVDGRLADAAKMFRELAESGNAQAQLRLAQMYELGQGVVQSFVEAARWFGAAAEQGSLPAQARLGEIYLVGLEAPKTATASAKAKIDAPEQPGSLLNRLFPQGLSIRPDPQKAAHWNGLAAQSGEAGAQARLGYQFATGLGTTLDLATAERWLSAAAAQGNAAGERGL